MRKKLAVIGMAIALSSVSLTGCGFEFSIGNEKPIFSSEKKDTETEVDKDVSKEEVKDTGNEETAVVKEATTEEEVEETTEEETDSIESSSQYSYYTMNSKVFNYAIGANRSDMTMEVFTDKQIDPSEVDLDNLSTLINEKGVKYFAVVGIQDMGTATLATLFNAEDEGGEETREEIASQFDGKASDRDIIDGHSFLRISTNDMGMDTDGLDESYLSGRLAMNGTKMYFILTADKDGNADKYMGDFIENMKFNNKESENEFVLYSEDSSNGGQFQSNTLPEDTDAYTEAETEASTEKSVSVSDSADKLMKGLTIDGNNFSLGSDLTKIESYLKKMGMSEDYSNHSSIGKYTTYRGEGNSNSIDIVSTEDGKVYSVKAVYNGFGEHRNFQIDGVDPDWTIATAKKALGEPSYESDLSLQYGDYNNTLELFFYDGKLSSVTVTDYTLKQD